MRGVHRRCSAAVDVVKIARITSEGARSSCWSYVDAPYSEEGHEMTGRMKVVPFLHQIVGCTVSAQGTVCCKERS